MEIFEALAKEFNIKEEYSNNLRGRIFSLSVVQESDEYAYEQAMQDYEYNKDVYEKTIADINAQTKAIQSKDGQET